MSQTSVPREKVLVSSTTDYVLGYLSGLCVRHENVILDKLREQPYCRDKYLLDYPLSEVMVTFECNGKSMLFKVFGNNDCGLYEGTPTSHKEITLVKNGSLYELERFLGQHVRPYVPCNIHYAFWKEPGCWITSHPAYKYPTPFSKFTQYVNANKDQSMLCEGWSTKSLMDFTMGFANAKELYFTYECGEYREECPINKFVTSVAFSGHSLRYRITVAHKLDGKWNVYRESRIKKLSPRNRHIKSYLDEDVEHFDEECVGMDVIDVNLHSWFDNK